MYLVIRALAALTGIERTQTKRGFEDAGEKIQTENINE